ncbi:PanC Panthothenate synthetase [actinobacterium SCGC AAA044-D11]
MDLDLKHPVALVPTMGALHAGHASLIEIARKFSSEVVVSIFVNPLQFENPNDFSTYPKSIDTDVKLATASGATKVWVPTFDEIYPNDPVLISSGEIGNLFEGVHRFGHFDGMLTVVKRLFDLASPKYAIFGEKDFQQLFLIKQMVAQMKLPIEIIQAPTIRETNGLAMSSRNQKLSVAERESAAGIYTALSAAKSASDLNSARLELSKGVLAIPNFLLDYAEIIDADTFAVADDSTANCRAIVAGWINGIRLIDNMAMLNLGDSK